jgi:uncharacterized protein (DUF1697 family)
MTVHIALLRAVNLAGCNKVAMTDLRALATGLGFTEAQTLLQSGNLVFRSEVTGAKLESMLEAEARKRLGIETAFIVRTARQWKGIAASNPFPAEAKSDPAHLLVMACKNAVAKDLKITGARREIVRPNGSEIYIYYPDGVGASRLKIDACGTARNWNTVLKLATLACA